MPRFQTVQKTVLDTITYRALELEYIQSFFPRQPWLNRTLSGFHWDSNVASEIRQCNQYTSTIINRQDSLCVSVCVCVCTGGVNPHYQLKNKDACACAAKTQCGTVRAQRVQLCVISIYTPCQNARFVDACLSVCALRCLSLVSSLWLATGAPLYPDQPCHQFG